MPKEKLFTKPVADVIPQVIKIAKEAAAGELGDAAEAAYSDQVNGFLDETGMTMDELDNLGAPTTWLGRLFERIEDWWWDFREGRQSESHSHAFEDVEAAFAFPVPILQTCPLEETPLEYDEVDVKWAEAAAQISAAISAETEWTSVAFRKPDFAEDMDDEDEDFDPAEQILGMWKSPTGAGHFFLVDQFEEDPKLMGQSMGVVHIPEGHAQEFIQHVSNV